MGAVALETAGHKMNAQVIKQKSRLGTAFRRHTGWALYVRSLIVVSGSVPIPTPLHHTHFPGAGVSLCVRALVI